SSSSSGSADTGTGEGVPKNVKRAWGIAAADYGAEIPINMKKVVKGGTFRLATTSTFTIGMDDPQLVVVGNRTQGITDRPDFQNGSFMNVLADPRAGIIPVEQDTIGWKDPLKIVGTGAWIETEYVSGQRETFKANPEYYRSWDEGGRPGIDTYEHIVIADRAS